MYLNNNVIDFPESEDNRLKEAIRLCADKTAQDALQIFIELIDKGCVEAYAYVGSIYEIGGAEIDPDYEKAYFYYERSAEETGSVESYLALARMCFYGLGRDVDYKNAFDFYQFIENEIENAIACLMLGKMYHHGLYVDKDLKMARSYYLRSSANGNIHALTCLGLLEKESGNMFSSILLRLKAAFITL